MREALDDVRARRTAIGAALENVRIQLLRLGAGVGRADDMREEVAAMRAAGGQWPGRDADATSLRAPHPLPVRSGVTTVRAFGDGGVLRPLLLALVAIGAAGLEVELLLLEHFESVLQWTPLVLLGGVLVAAALVWRRPSSSTVRFFQAVMLLCVAAGVVGVFLHYRGNVEFELERESSLRGVEAVLGVDPRGHPRARSGRDGPTGTARVGV